MFNPGDRVDVLRSRCGYKGPGDVIDQAYGGFYLVKVPADETEEKRWNPIILVKFTDLRTNQSATSPPKVAKGKKARD